MAPSKSTAEAWKYYTRKPLNKVACTLCGHQFTASLTRAVDHLLSMSNGRGGGVEGCKNVTPEIRERINKENKSSKQNKTKILAKRQRVEGEISMSSFVSSSNIRATNSSGVGTLNNLWKPIEKQTVDDAVADMFYACAIPFNVARSPYFINAFKKVVEFGKGYTPPRYGALRSTLLQRSKERVTDKLSSIKESWKDTGCIIMSDGWSDTCHRPLINVLVSCPQGVMFLRVIDAMNVVKTSDYIFSILKDAIDEVGAENVVQIVTDNATNCVGAGKMIMERFPNIFWTPCAAHCVDLLLHDLAKLPWVNEVVRRAKMIANFIINHRLTLSIYREHASKELLRPCDTRFATFYITLQRVIEQKTALRSVVCHAEWESSSLSKSEKGKHVESIILGTTFWESAIKVQKLCDPIVHMLREVDSDKPTMGFVYEGMDRCKEAIASAFNNVEDDYKHIWEMVDYRWKMMHSPLHAAACYLDPRIFGLRRNNDTEVMHGLYAAIERLNPDQNIANKLRGQLRAYRLQEGLFGISAAKADRTATEPGVWWDFYGADAPELQCFAIRILSQCSSASACERNWSSFEQIHTKKRNKLLSGQLGDLVYVRSNLRLSTCNVAKESENSSSPSFHPVSHILEDEHEDIEPGYESYEHESISPPCALDNMELDDVTSEYQGEEQQE